MTKTSFYTIASEVLSQSMRSNKHGAATILYVHRSHIVSAECEVSDLDEAFEKVAEGLVLMCTVRNRHLLCSVIFTSV